MRVIFLDVDGVLNCNKTPDRSPNGFIGIEDDKVSKLKKIVDATNAVIVLTSTWKREWNKDKKLCSKEGSYLESKLESFDLKIYDKTTDSIFDRGKGIHNWLENTKVESWIAIDDDTFYDYEHYEVLPHLIKTHWLLGLTDRDVESAIKILNKTGGKNGEI